MSLADELLADPDFITTRDEETNDIDNDELEDVTMRDLEEVEEDDMVDDLEEEKQISSEVEMKNVMDVRKIAKLLGSRQMKDVLM
ncbi:25492_t:CDS:1, partial [Racocetra persica]